MTSKTAPDSNGKPRVESPTTEINALAIAAMEYAARGWNILPLHEKDKKPRLPRWQSAASADEEQIAKWWEQWPGSNVGVLLGERSNLIDIEIDSAQQKEDLVQLFGGRVPFTPTFASGRLDAPGQHHLFRWRDDLPGGAVVYYKSVGIRTGNDGKGAQSVFPPSIHPSGKRYEWIVSPDEAGIAEMPDNVVRKLREYAQSKNGAPKSAAVPAAVATAEFPPDQVILEKIAGAANADKFVDLMAGEWRKYGYASESEADLAIAGVLAFWTQDAGQIARIMRTSRLAREKWNREDYLSRTVQKALSGTGKFYDWRCEQHGGWRLRIVGVDPPAFFLASPFFDGEIELTPSQFLKFGAVRTAALTQKRKCLPPVLSKVWDGNKGKPGLAQELVDSAIEVEAPPELDRSKTLQERIKDWAASVGARWGKARAEPEEISLSDLPTKGIDGAVWFTFGQLLDALNDRAVGDERVKRPELVAAISALGARDEHIGRDRAKRCVKCLPREAVREGAVIRGGSTKCV